MTYELRTPWLYSPIYASPSDDGIIDEHMSLRQSEFKLSPEQLIQKTKNFVSKVSVHFRLPQEGQEQLKMGKSNLWLPFSLRRELLPSSFSSFLHLYHQLFSACGNHKGRNTRTFLRDFQHFWRFFKISWVFVTYDFFNKSIFPFWVISKILENLSKCLEVF